MLKGFRLLTALAVTVVAWAAGIAVPILCRLLPPSPLLKYSAGAGWLLLILAAGGVAWRRRFAPPAVILLLGLLALVPWLMLLGTWGDEWEYLANLDSLVVDGDLDTLNQIYSSGSHLPIRYGRFEPLPYWFSPTATTGYMPHALCYGYLAWLLPGWVLAGRFGVHLMQALAAVLLWLAVDRYRRQFGGRDDADANGLLFLSVPVLCYTFHIYPELLAAAIAIVLLVELWRDGELPAWRWGTLCALLLWLNLRYLLLAAPLLLLGWRRRGRGFTRAAGVFLALALLLGLLQIPVYRGLPSVGKEREYFTSDFYVGLAGNFLDGEYGVLPYAPLWAWLPLGGLIVWQTRRSRLIDLLVVTLPYLLVMSSYRRFWYGGQAPPGRFVALLFPLWFPLLLAAIPPLTAGFWRRLWRLAVAWTLAFSFLITLVPSWRYNIRLDGMNQILLFVSPWLHLDLTVIFPAFRVTAITPASWLLAGIYLILWAALTMAAWRSYGRQLARP